jgi:FixJ family two-component response regulator
MTVDRPLVAIIDSDDQSLAELGRCLGAAGLTVELFNSAEDFLKRTAFPSPHCILLDVRLPGMSGLDLQVQQVKLGRKTPLLFLTTQDEVKMCVQAMKIGAIDYLMKPFQAQQVLDAVNRGIKLNRAQRLQERILGELRARLASLSARERETMAMLSAGLGPKQIAGILRICTHTARVYSSRIMCKMGARSIADLVRMADRIAHGSGEEAIFPDDIRATAAANLSGDIRTHASPLTFRRRAAAIDVRSPSLSVAQRIEVRAAALPWTIYRASCA